MARTIAWRNCHLFCSFLLMLVNFRLSSSATSSSTSPQTASKSSNDDNKSFKVEGIQPDRFVLAAPLIIAAGSHRRSESSTQSEPVLDLPESFGGPFRIQTIDAYGTTFLATGWRADCDLLVDQARELAATEQRRHGTPSNSSSLYVSLLARELSLFMAHLAVSEGIRSLSSVGLLVAPVSDSGDPSLWLVDATGAYPVRAMCVGGGMGNNNDKRELVAKLAQKRLREMDFSGLTGQEGLQHLMRLLTGGNSKDNPETSISMVKPGTRLEMAVLDNSRRKLIRKHLKSLGNSPHEG